MRVSRDLVATNDESTGRSGAVEEREFLDSVKSSGASFRTRKDRYHFSCKSPKKPAEITDYLYVSWTSGGTRGGGCYGTEPEPREPDPEPDFEDLDMILGKVCPNITFLQYKSLMKKVEIESDSYTIDEYYGNSTQTSYKAILLKNLYDALTEASLI